jgi:hypothetical protein
MEQLRANGQPRAHQEPAPAPARLQREPETQLQRELLPNPQLTRVEREAWEEVQWKSWMNIIPESLAF